MKPHFCGLTINQLDNSLSLIQFKEYINDLLDVDRIYLIKIEYMAFPRRCCHVLWNEKLRLVGFVLEFLDTKHQDIIVVSLFGCKRYCNKRHSEWGVLQWYMS